MSLGILSPLPTHRGDNRKMLAPSHALHLLPRCQELISISLIQQLVFQTESYTSTSLMFFAHMDPHLQYLQSSSAFLLLLSSKRVQMPVFGFLTWVSANPPRKRIPSLTIRGLYSSFLFIKTVSHHIPLANFPSRQVPPAHLQVFLTFFNATESTR